MRCFYSDHHEGFLCLGRKRPTGEVRKLVLRDYMDRLPSPPASCDYTIKAAPALGKMYLNDQLGDCVIAGGYHVLGALKENAASDFLANDQQIIADYGAIGGYVPGKPSTDQGCDEQTALRYWTQKGFADGSRLAGWLSESAQNQQEYLTALWLFENLYFGLELPDSYLNVRPGFLWDQGMPDPSNGHCIAGFGYGATGVTISTWGMVGTMTHRAIQQIVSARYGGELYVLLSPEILNKATQKAPSGLDWPSLIADFNALGGNVPMPDPAPQPIPVPPVPLPPAWQPFLAWLEKEMSSVFWPVMKPVIFALIEKIPMPPIVIQAIEMLLTNVLGSSKPMLKYTAI